MFLSLAPLHFIFLLLFILFPTVLWVLALIDIIKSNFKDDTTKIIWVLVVILVPLIGSIIYFAMRDQFKVSSK